MSDDVLTRDSDGNLAVRTVSSTGDNYVNPDDVYTRDSDGKLCVRVTGEGGGGDQHNLGYFATQAALEEAYPTAEAGDWAIVGATDTVWIWDTDNSAWVDSDQKGQVTSVNNKTGAVVLNASDVGAVPQKTTMPTATAEMVGEIVQFTGTTDANYTNGYFYKCVSDGETPATYSWERVDIQPAGETGIDWETVVDLPADYAGSPWDACPIYTIEGGLPDGEYEFYMQTRCGTNTQVPLGEVTYKIRLDINNSELTCGGVGAPIINGMFIPDGNTRLPENENSVNNFLYKNGDDLIIFAVAKPFITDIPPYRPGVEIDGCFKLSAIKNVTTGDEYIASGEVYDGTPPTYTDSFQGYITFNSIQESVDIPNQFLYTTVSFDDNNQYFRVSPYTGVAGENISITCAELDIALVSSNGGRWHIIVENSVNNYDARLIEASGDLADCQLGLNEYNQVIVKINTPSGSSGSISVTVGGKACTKETNAYFYPDSNVQSFTPVRITQVGETIDTYLLGKVLQYTGETNANYTKGYFYKANGTIVVTPQSVVASNISPNDFAITIDTDDFMAALVNITGWEEDYTRQVLNNVPNWMVVYDADNGTVTRLWWTAYGDFYDPTLLSTVTVSTTGTYTGGVNVSFDTNYTPESQTVTGASWDRIDVQPSSSPIIPATMPTLAVADWSSNTQTVNVTGVTATNTVFVSPDPASAADYASAGIICTAQGAGTLTFTCATVPSNAITVNVVIL